MLAARKEPALGEVECHGGQQASTDQVDGVMMREVHGGPPHPQRVADKHGFQAGENVAHEEGGQCGIRGVEGWKCAKDHGGLMEARGVEVDAEELVDPGQAGRIALDGVVGRGETVEVFVPRRRAWKSQLDQNGRHADVAKGAGKKGHGPRRAEDEHDEGNDKWRSIMADSVG